jgi:hypothetical protein
MVKKKKKKNYCKLLFGLFFPEIRTHDNPRNPPYETFITKFLISTDYRVSYESSKRPVIKTRKFAWNFGTIRSIHQWSLVPVSPTIFLWFFI